jgi:hypothetical protein
MKQLLAGFFACALSACSTSGVPMAPQPSPHFDAVSSELQLGGTVYLYADIDGDAERASDFLLGVLRDSPELLTLSAPARLNATAMARVLGLDRARAVGLSSYESEGLFRNRGFIYADAREGLLRVLGGQPAKFDMVEIAPRSTDLVWRQDLDVGALLDVIRGLGALGVGLSPEALETALDQPFLTLDVTLRSVLEGLSPTIGVILDVDDTRNLWIPGESFTFPYADFIVSIEGLERVADAIIRYAASDPFVRAKRADGWTIVSPAIRLPPPWNAYEPSVIKEVATGRMYLVSSPSFLKECLATSAGVTTTADFGRAMQGLPETGNGLLYLSPQMTRAMHAALDQVVATNGPAAQTHLARFLLPAAGEAFGWVLHNKPQGILFTSNSASSHKSTLLMLGYAAVLPAVAVVGASWLAPEPDPQ